MTPAPRREKRKAPLTLHAMPALKLAIQTVAQREDLSASTWLLKLAKAQPAIQAELQKGTA